MSIDTLTAPDQPAQFQFSKGSEAEIQKAISKYPKDRQASAVKSLLYIAQRQHDNWIPLKAIEAIAKRLAMPEMRVLEVASFYSMFNLKPVGKYFLQLCGTTPCMLCGSDEVARCIKDRLDIISGQTSSCGMFTLREVECLGACVNAPILQVNDDFYEDMDYQATADLIAALQSGHPPPAGSAQNRQASEAKTGTTTLKTLKRAGKTLKRSGKPPKSKKTPPKLKSTSPKERIT